MERFCRFSLSRQMIEDTRSCSFQFKYSDEPLRDLHCRTCNLMTPLSHCQHFDLHTAPDTALCERQRPCEFSKPKAAQVAVSPKKRRPVIPRCSGSTA